MYVDETLWSESNVSAQSIYRELNNISAWCYGFVFVLFIYKKNPCNNDQTKLAAFCVQFVRIHICLMLDAYTLCENIYKKKKKKNGEQIKEEGN